MLELQSNMSNEKNYLKTRCKGIKKHIINHLDLTNFIDVIFNHKRVYINVGTFIKDKLEIYNAIQRKKALELGCTKRVFFSKHDSHAYGNANFPQIDEEKLPFILPHFNLEDFIALNLDKFEK